jgi:hypothetical protein
MGKGMFMAWSSPVSAEEDASFNTWYDEIHVPQVRKAVPSITDVRRYALLGSGQDGGVRRYLACYELADEDAAGAAAAIHAAGSSGGFDMSPAFDTSKAAEIFFLEPLD